MVGTSKDVMKFLMLMCLLPAVQAQVRLTGRITDETGKPVSGARVTFRHSDGKVMAEAISDPAGGFQCGVPGAGKYKLEVDREGYFQLTKPDFTLESPAGDLQLILNSVREVVQSMDVTANPGDVALDRTSPQQTLSGNDLLNVPYPATNTLRNAMRIMPGMVQDGRGGVHMNGAAEEQTLYTLEGFQINDPLTGRFESRLSVESVQSLEATSGRPGAEFGKGSAGVLAIRSRTGDDKLRYSATNFVPGVEYQKGLLIGGWTPRLNVSGPWRKGKAWFSDSFDIQFTNTVISELPKGEDRFHSWRASNLLHNQFNLTPSNILTIGSLFNFWSSPRNGLSRLDPRETTLDRRSRQWFTYLKDQQYFARGAVLEIGFAHNRTFGREIPQGDGIYVVTPFGRFGNNFIDALRKGGRDQFIVNGFLPVVSAFGEHQLKAGIDLDRLRYWQDVRRSGIEYATIDLVPLRRTVFEGSGQLHRANFETSAYLQDSWRIRPLLHIELGLRTDWDRILHGWNLSPRLGFAWSPFGLQRTRISGGYGRIYDATNLRTFTRPDDQFSISTYFHPDGEIARGPALSVYGIDSRQLASPRYDNWNMSVEHELPRSIQARMNFTARRGNRGLTYINQLDQLPSLPEAFGGIANPVFDAIYGLAAQRRDRYHALEITLRQPIRQRYQWMISYTRSRSRSNAVVDQSVDEPLVVSDNSGALPWDAPNRWLSWGYLPTPLKKWAVAYLAEYRTGFPFTIQDNNGQAVGPLNALRYPAFFELNLHLERTLSMRGQWWAVRFGFNNITNHKNPNVVNNVVGSSNFLQMFGGQSRAFNVRVRWLGKQ